MINAIIDKGFDIVLALFVLRKNCFVFSNVRRFLCGKEGQALLLVLK